MDAVQRPQSMRLLSEMATALITAAHPRDLAMHRALFRAHNRLQHREWLVDGGQLRVQSESNPAITWLTDGEHCECPARGMCWHRAAWRLLSVLAAVCGLEPGEDGQLVIAFPAMEDVQPPSLDAVWGEDVDLGPE